MTAVQAGDLRRNDQFRDVDPEKWEEMTPKERNKVRRVKVLALGPECKHDTTRVHLVTDAGNWCIPFVAQLVRADADGGKAAA